MRRIRYRIAYLLRLIAYKIEPHPSLLDLHIGDLIRRIDPIDTPVWRGLGKGDD